MSNLRTTPQIWDCSCPTPNSENNEDNHSNPEMICIRYDKTNKMVNRTPNLSQYTHVTPLYSYMEEARRSKDLFSKLPNKIDKEYSDSPLSPNSHKKELCRYLKLNPAEETYKIIRKNRRSMRVRNHTELMEQKKNDKTEMGEFDTVNRLLPLPRLDLFEEIADFEDDLKEIIAERSKDWKMKYVKNRKSKKLDWKRINSLRSKVKINKSFDEIMWKKKKKKKKKFSFKKESLKLRTTKIDRKPEGKMKINKSKTDEKKRIETKSNEKKTIEKKREEKRGIESKKSVNEYKNIDLQNFIDDMLELDTLSEEHRKSVIENRIYSSVSIANLISEKKTDINEENLAKACKMFHQFIEPFTINKEIVENKDKIVVDFTENCNLPKENPKKRKNTKLIQILNENERKKKAHYRNFLKNKQKNFYKKPQKNGNFLKRKQISILMGKLKNSTNQVENNKNTLKTDGHVKETHISNDEKIVENGKSKIELKTENCTFLNHKQISILIEKLRDSAKQKEQNVPENNEKPTDTDKIQKTVKNGENEPKVENDNDLGNGKITELKQTLIAIEHNYAHINNVEKTDDEDEEDDETELSDSEKPDEISDNSSKNDDIIEIIDSGDDIKVETNDTSEMNGESEESDTGEELELNKPQNVDVVPYNNNNSDKKSLHRNLILSKRKLYINDQIERNLNHQSWDTPNNNNNNNNKKLKSHLIQISNKNGNILNIFYVDYNLIVIQEMAVSFWQQSALGNILGAQNMYIPNGEIKRLILNKKNYIRKITQNMIISIENSCALVELWINEHKSDKREGPLADVFVCIYFWRYRQNGLDKKVLQLENIKGFSDDVQYIVVKNCPKIIVSWHCVTENSKITNIHSYQLASDYQTVASIRQIQSIGHYVSSLHNIEDCENLILGCGENKLTLWNIEFGYIVATINLNEIKLSLSTLWAKCDRGFLFTIHQTENNELNLFAINGINHLWKKLQVYQPPSGFKSVKGVCIENGILIAFYDEGIICWNAQTGEPVVEEVPNETKYLPSGNYVIMIVNEQILVKHALSHFITNDDY